MASTFEIQQQLFQLQADMREMSAEVWAHKSTPDLASRMKELAKKGAELYDQALAQVRLDFSGEERQAMEGALLIHRKSFDWSWTALHSHALMMGLIPLIKEASTTCEPSKS